VETEQQSWESLAKLLREQRLCVLATQDTRGPYASLVAFGHTDDLHTLLFSTSRQTHKYANLSAASQVAILIDDSRNVEEDFHGATAVTAIGRATLVAKDDLVRFRDLFLAKHPGLAVFLRAPTCALIRVDVERYYIVTRFQSVVELKVT